jgi:Zn-dependent protease with chaperone function
MTTIIHCQSCGARLKLKAGKTTFRGSCPGCHSRIDWSAPPIEADEAPEPPVEMPDDEPFVFRTNAALPPPVNRRPKRPEVNHAAVATRELLAGFQGTIPARGPGSGYRLALLLTAGAICLLTVLYLAIVAATGYGTWWYATNILPTGMLLRGRATVLLMLFHITVVLAGISTLLSMIISMIPRKQDDSSGQQVTVGQAPVLHALVSRIADALGSPVPVEIRLTLDVNASASYAGGLLGLVRRKLVLTIGAPLIAGMTTQQLAGIIAHELGHFSQRGGLLLRHFVFRFVVWCANASGMQQSLAERASEGDAGESASVALVRFVYWATQSIGALVVRALALLGLLVTMFVSRRQEYDADRYEASLTGSAAFFGTVRRLIELSMGYRDIIRRGPSYLLPLLTGSQGMENFASEVVAAADANAHKAVKKIEKALQQPTGWFDSHPADRERIKAIQALPQQGIFHLTTPAWHLYPQLNPNFKASAERNPMA